MWIKCFCQSFWYQFILLDLYLLGTFIWLLNILKIIIQLSQIVIFYDPSSYERYVIRYLLHVFKLDRCKHLYNNLYTSVIIYKTSLLLRPKTALKENRGKQIVFIIFFMWYGLGAPSRKDRFANFALRNCS